MLTVIWLVYSSFCVSGTDYIASVIVHVDERARARDLSFALHNKTDEIILSEREEHGLAFCLRLDVLKTSLFAILQQMACFIFMCIHML